MQKVTIQICFEIITLLIYMKTSTIYEGICVGNQLDGGGLQDMD